MIIKAKIFFLAMSCFFSLLVANSIVAKTYICTGDYALCDAAPCLPVAGYPKKAFCRCQVKNGYSFAHKPCQKSRKMIGDYSSIVSRYYPIDKNTNLVLCKVGYPWANCLEKSCFIAGKSPTRAICGCDVVDDKNSVIVVEKCTDKTACISGFTAAIAFHEWLSIKKTLAKQNIMPKLNMTICHFPKISTQTAR
ncbi:MAG: hypothetical protein A3F41_05235 [Coxiella sp. RIFCSPHIGHO2_12_FULL_44_14]|nr:MAG: hypothetical protein A3F41_05235 [Coxiella sp. RIFCSPHIGHO2_12_FULL_44_14]